MSIGNRGWQKLSIDGIKDIFIKKRGGVLMTEIHFNSTLNNGITKNTDLNQVQEKSHMRGIPSI